MNTIPSMRFSMKTKFLLPLVAGSLAMCSSMFAADTTWIGTTNLWSSSGNWSGGLPSEGNNAVFYGPTASVFAISGANANRVAGGLEFLGSDSQSVSITIADATTSTSTRTLRIYSGTATSGGDIVVDSGASGTFSILAFDTAGPRQLIWGPGVAQTAPVENHSILNNSTTATLVIGVEQYQNSATATTALNLTYGGAGNINVTAPINVNTTGGGRTVNLIKQDAGTLTLSATNGYNGSTTISGGVLQLGDGGTTGSLVSTSLVTNNATLTFNRSDNPVVANTITGSGAVRQVGSGTTILTGANDYTGPTTITGGTLQIGNAGSLGSITSDVSLEGGNLTFAKTGTTTYGGSISGTTGVFQKLNSGTLILTGVSSFSGTTSIQSTANNNIRLANTNALQNSTVSVSVTNGLQFDTATNSYTIGALSGGSNFAVQNISAGAVALRAGNNNASTTYSGVMSGTGSLVKIGSGTLTLSGSNAFTGDTTISAGTVLLSGAGKVGDGNVVVNGALNITGITGSIYALTGSQTLSGAGTIFASGKTLSVAGTLAPGNSPGTLTVDGGFSLENTAVSNFEINGTSAGQFDQLVVNGDLTLSGTLNLSTGFGAGLGDTVDLFNWTTLSGTFASITGTDLGGGLSWDTSALYTNGAITVVPEPSTVHVLIFSAGLMLLLPLRRRLC